MFAATRCQVLYLNCCHWLKEVEPEKPSHVLANSELQSFPHEPLRSSGQWTDLNRPLPTRGTGPYPRGKSVRKCSANPRRLFQSPCRGLPPRQSHRFLSMKLPRAPSWACISRRYQSGSGTTDGAREGPL